MTEPLRSDVPETTPRTRPGPRSVPALRALPGSPGGDERLLPATDRRPNLRVLPGPPAAPRARAGAAPAKAREKRRPIHLVVTLGLSAAAYATVLAGVTALQSGSEQAQVADHAPTAQAIDLLRSEHDRLAARLAAAGQNYSAAASAYNGVTDSLGSLETQLGSLAQSVGKVKGSAASLPKIPVYQPSSVSTTVRVVTSKPAAAATTCASGKSCP